LAEAQYRTRRGHYSLAAGLIALLGSDLEVSDAPRFVEAWERAGYMTSAEASAWRERIAVWRRFRAGGLEAPNRAAADPLLDDPDPFLSSSRAA